MRRERRSGVAPPAWRPARPRSGSARKPRPTRRPGWSVPPPGASRARTRAGRSARRRRPTAASGRDRSGRSARAGRSRRGPPKRPAIPSQSRRPPARCLRPSRARSPSRSAASRSLRALASRIAAAGSPSRSTAVSAGTRDARWPLRRPRTDSPLHQPRRAAPSLGRPGTPCKTRTRQARLRHSRAARP